jgi:hypothetical protein
MAPVPPSDLSLLGVVRHMADMERAWFRIRFRGEPLPRLYDYEDAAFQHSDPACADADFAAFTGECDLARKAFWSASINTPPRQGLVAADLVTLGNGAQAVIADLLPRRRLVLDGGPSR